MASFSQDKGSQDLWEQFENRSDGTKTVFLQQTVDQWNIKLQQSPLNSTSAVFSVCFGLNRSVLVKEAWIFHVCMLKHDQRLILFFFFIMICRLLIFWSYFSLCSNKSWTLLNPETVIFHQNSRWRSSQLFPPPHKPFTKPILSKHGAQTLVTKTKPKKQNTSAIIHVLKRSANIL